MAPRAGDGSGSSTGPDGVPEGSGEAYARFQEGSRLLDSGNPHAANVALERARDLDPENGYAHFGLGLCLLRSGDRAGARGHLKMATIMRPDEEAYQDALRQA